MTRYSPAPRGPETITVGSRTLTRTDDCGGERWDDETETPHLSVVRQWTGGPYRVEAWWSPGWFRVTYNCATEGEAASVLAGLMADAPPPPSGGLFDRVTP